MRIHASRLVLTANFVTCDLHSPPLPRTPFSLRAFAGVPGPTRGFCAYRCAPRALGNTYYQLIWSVCCQCCVVGRFDAFEVSTFWLQPHLLFPNFCFLSFSSWPRLLKICVPSIKWHDSSQHNALLTTNWVHGNWKATLAKSTWLPFGLPLILLQIRWKDSSDSANQGLCQSTDCIDYLWKDYFAEIMVKKSIYSSLAVFLASFDSRGRHILCVLLQSFANSSIWFILIG